MSEQIGHGAVLKNQIRAKIQSSGDPMLNTLLEKVIETLDWRGNVIDKARTFIRACDAGEEVHLHSADAAHEPYIQLKVALGLSTVDPDETPVPDHIADRMKARREKARREPFPDVDQDLPTEEARQAVREYLNARYGVQAASEVGTFGSSPMIPREFVLIRAPRIGHLASGETMNERLRTVAHRLDNNLSVGGRNTRDGVARMLRDAADAMEYTEAEHKKAEAEKELMITRRTLAEAYGFTEEQLGLIMPSITPPQAQRLKEALSAMPGTKFTHNVGRGEMEAVVAYPQPEAENLVGTVRHDVLGLTEEMLEDIRQVSNCAAQHGNIASRDAAARLENQLSRRDIGMTDEQIEQWKAKFGPSVKFFVDHGENDITPHEELRRRYLGDAPTKEQVESFRKAAELAAETAQKSMEIDIDSYYGGK